MFRFAHVSARGMVHVCHLSPQHLQFAPIPIQPEAFFVAVPLSQTCISGSRDLFRKVPCTAAPCDSDSSHPGSSLQISCDTPQQYMAKFPRRGASVSKTRTAGVVFACALLALFAISSKSDWLQTSAQSSKRPEGRSLRATDSSSASSTSFFRQSVSQPSVSHSVGDDVLVLYLYDNRDPVWVENFNFFLQWGIKYNDGCSYIILVSEAMYAAKVTQMFRYTSSPRTVLHIPLQLFSCRRTYQTLQHYRLMLSIFQPTPRTVHLDLDC